MFGKNRLNPNSSLKKFLFKMRLRDKIKRFLTFALVINL